MPRITITRAADDRLRCSRFADGLTDDWPTRDNDDGTVSISVHDDVIARLDDLRYPGESDSELIIRLVEFGDSGGLH